MLKDKYKTNIYLQDKYPHDPVGRDIYKYQVKEYLENSYENMNILFNENLPTNLLVAFHIIKLLIEKGNLNLIHNKNSYQHFPSPKILLVLYSCELLLTIHTTYQSTYIIDYFLQANFKYIRKSRKSNKYIKSYKQNNVNYFAKLVFHL